MPLKTIKAKASQASALLNALLRQARALKDPRRVLVVYAQGEPATITVETEPHPTSPR